MKIIWKWNAHSRRTNNAREHNSGFDSFFLQNIFSGPVFFFACHKKPAQINTIEVDSMGTFFSYIVIIQYDAVIPGKKKSFLLWFDKFWI